MCHTCVRLAVASQYTEFTEMIVILIDINVTECFAGYNTAFIIEGI